MKCTICRAWMDRIESDLPFKTAWHRIVILKNLPVLQCENCTGYLMEDPVMHRVDQILATVASDAEIEVILYAA